MLNLMTQKLNLEASEILVIGDCYKIDIQVANQLGARSTLISKEDEIKHSDCKTAKNLKDILELW